MGSPALWMVAMVLTYMKSYTDIYWCTIKRSGTDVLKHYQRSIVDGLPKMGKVHKWDDERESGEGVGT